MEFGQGYVTRINIFLSRAELVDAADETLFQPIVNSDDHMLTYSFWLLIQYETDAPYCSVVKKRDSNVEAGFIIFIFEML